MKREVQTLQARRHEHIVPLLSSWCLTFMESERLVGSLNLLFPYSSMTLHDWLNGSEPPQHWKNYDPKALKDYIYHSMTDICDAVAYLHKDIGGLISSHHDLKPDNILLFGKVWKLGDFGRTHLMHLSAGSDTEGRSGLGTFTYHPPEYYNDAGDRADVRHGRAFDVWSLGCIFVEFATVAVYGWSPQRLREFKGKRSNNTARSKVILSKRGSDDTSYHNNMIIVENWLRQLRDHDGSTNLTSILDIAEAMLKIDPYDRPLSWEVHLDLDELLNPNKTNAEKKHDTQNRVQAPNRRHPKKEQNPLQRAAIRGNKTRVECLLKAGWSDYHVDISKLDGEDKYPIVQMLVIAKYVKGMKWRRTTKILKQERLRISSSSRLTGNSRQQHQIQASRRYHETVTGFKNMNQRSPSSHPDISQAKTEKPVVLDQDGRGMTQLHRYCDENDFWRVRRLSDTLDSDSFAKVMTCEDSQGRLPLHYAAKNGSQRIVEHLLANFELDTTALVAWPDHEGRTPLHAAAQNGNEDTIRSLLKAHVNEMKYVKIEDQSEKTARDLALSRGAIELLDRILFPPSRIATA